MPGDASYHALFHVSPAPLLILKEGTILYANPAAMELFGAETLERIPLPSVVTKAEMTLMRPDGKTVQVEISAWPLADDHRGASTVLMFSDITARRAAERALRESEERFRTLFEDAPIAYHEIDDQGVLRRVNRAECELLGFDRSALIGRPVWELAMVSPEERETSHSRVVQKLQGRGRLMPFERPCARRDGEILILEVH